MHANITCQIFKTRSQIKETANFLVFVQLVLELRFGFNSLGQRQRLVLFDRDQLRQLIAEVVRQVEHAPNVADHRFRRHRAKGDNLRNGVRAVFFAYVFNHAPAIILTEIDIEVGHRYPFRIQEALKEQRITQGVKIGNTERVSNQRPGARTPPGADRDAIFLGPVNEIGNDQEVAGELHANDRIGLDLQAGIVDRTLPGSLFDVREQLLQAQLKAASGFLTQKIIKRNTVRRWKIREVVLAQRNRQVTAFGDFH